MRRVSLISGSLRVDDPSAAVDQSHHTGDWVSVFTPKAVHELRFDPAHATPPVFIAVHIAKQVSSDRPMVWVDSSASFYPPAVGLDANRLYLIRPQPTDLSWTAVECLRCRHIGAVIAMMPDRPTRVDVRRLQLAAEQGGGVGILLRPDVASAGSHIYSAASRWRVSPVPGERTIQRWRVEHIHGQGRQFGPSFIVEKHRATGQTNFVYPPAALADHATAATSFGELHPATVIDPNRAAS